MKTTTKEADLPLDARKRRDRERRGVAAREKAKAKGFDKMSRAEKDDLLSALLEEHGYIGPK